MAKVCKSGFSHSYFSYTRKLFFAGVNWASGYLYYIWVSKESVQTAQLLKQQDIQHIIGAFFKRLRKYARKIKRGDSAEAIHLFRVEIKKLRAFLRLLSLELKKENSLKLPSKIKEMYQYAGKLRDSQLHHERMKFAVKNSELQIPEVKMVWKGVAGKKEKMGNRWLSDKDFFAAELKLNKKLPNEIGTATVNAFFSLKLGTILSLVTKGSFADEELHTIRKNLKDIIYIVKLYRTDMKEKLPFIFRNKGREKVAEELAHELGTYNDLCMDVHFLEKAIKMNSASKNTEMESLLKIFLVEKRKLKKKIVAGISSPDLLKLKRQVTKK